MPCFEDDRGMPRIMYAKEAALLTLGPMAISDTAISRRSKGKATKADAPGNDECMGCCCSILCFPVRIIIVPIVALASVCETVGHRIVLIMHNGNKK